MLEGIGDPETRHPASVHDAAAVVALGRLAIHCGDEARRRRCAELGRGLIETGPRSVQRHGVWLLALLSSADGDHAQARRYLCALGEASRLDVLPRFLPDVTDEIELARIATRVRDTDLAEAAMRSARDRADLNPGVFSIAGTLAHIRALMRDDGDAFAEAIENFEQGPRPLALASALEDSGLLALRRSRPSGRRGRQIRPGAGDLYAPGGVMGRRPGAAPPAFPGGSPSARPLMLHATAGPRSPTPSWRS